MGPWVFLTQSIQSNHLNIPIGISCYHKLSDIHNHMHMDDEYSSLAHVQFGTQFFVITNVIFVFYLNKHTNTELTLRCNIHQIYLRPLWSLSCLKLDTANISRPTTFSMALQSIHYVVIDASKSGIHFAYVANVATLYPQSVGVA